MAFKSLKVYNDREKIQRLWNVRFWLKKFFYDLRKSKLYYVIFKIACFNSLHTMFTQREAHQLFLTLNW